ncbi:MAG: peptidoglycan DD-metalloendopeptidase family protein [Flavipsychrobacter sp.]|nr:peptidoglycan DD-metalloendopeptidase family protein [Flavipsychrobacter sp.]
MRLLLFLICFGLCVPVFAQQTSASRTDLENKRKQIMDAIRETEDQLEATKKDKKATIGQLRALQNKLAERQKLIGNINSQIDQISTNIELSSSEVAMLRQKLEELKTRYAQTIRYAYENRSTYDMMAFLFSSSDFNDAVRRMQYLKKFRDYRKHQVDLIRSTQVQIEHKIGVLNTEKSQKDELLSSQVEQKQVLEKETNETNKVVLDLKGREKELATNIEKNRKAAKQLDRAISDIIRREIEIARKKAEEEAARQAAIAAAKNPVSKYGGGKTTTTTINLGNSNNNTRASRNNTPSSAAPSYALSLTPEVTALSNNFQANKGRLPWPVSKGFIAEPFGRHKHAVEEKVMVDNLGVEIQTNAGASAFAVFDGTVTTVGFVPGMGQYVLVNHGQYFTVYSGITNVTVKKGDKVKMKQSIGTVMANDDGVPMIHFELWKVAGNNSSSPVDPATWIAPLRG